MGDEKQRMIEWESAVKDKAFVERLDTLDEIELTFVRLSVEALHPH